jgi:DNA-binding transcriptional ArsR family regulator
MQFRIQRSQKKHQYSDELFLRKPVHRERPLLILAAVKVDFLPGIHNNMVVDRLSTTFAALSDPTRRRILNRLTRGPATVHELARPFSISQQAISKHLAYLERAQLIEKSRCGREQVCTLKPAAIKGVATWASRYRRFWDESYDRLDELLVELKNQGNE